MTISVLIPVYNGARTIRSTLESVLNQSVAPAEIIVLNDGSTDDTTSVVKSCGPRVTLISVPNGGVAKARNILCRCAQGDALAFVDADDIWHPDYLKIQQAGWEKYPTAVAFYTGHVNFWGDADYQWEASGSCEPELIPPLDYLIRYNRKTGAFGSMSYCCILRAAVSLLGENPFCIDSVEDSYLACELALLGPVVYTPAQLVAYRITPDSLSADHLTTCRRWIGVFELLAPRYETPGDPLLSEAFRRAFASKRRVYSKMLMGKHRVQEARAELRRSLRESTALKSRAKSFGILAATYLPAWAQPQWLSGERRVQDSPACGQIQSRLR